MDRDQKNFDLENELADAKTEARRLRRKVRPGFWWGLAVALMTVVATPALALYAEARDNHDVVNVYFGRGTGVKGLYAAGFPGAVDFVQSVALSFQTVDTITVAPKAFYGNDAGLVLYDGGGTYYDAGAHPVSAANPLPVTGPTSGPGSAVGSPSYQVMVAQAANAGFATLPIGIIPVDAGYLAATQVPAADAGLATRTSLTLQNLDTSPIWCGFTSGVSDLNGTQVDGSPDGTHAGGTFAVPNPANLPVYCWSRAGQVSPANIRWTEVQ